MKAMMGHYGKKPNSFLDMGSVDCLELLQQKINKINLSSETDWHKRTQLFDQQDSYNAVIFNKADPAHTFFNKDINNQFLMDVFEENLINIYQKIEQVYPDGEAKRVMLLKLPAKKKVLPHCDLGYYLHFLRRIHLPIVTNNNVIFLCNGIEVPMEAGKLIEVNNNVTHSVENNSDIDRIHMVIDWHYKGDTSYGKISLKDF